MLRSLLLFLSLLLSLLLTAAAHCGDNDEDSYFSSDGDQHADMRSKSLILARILCLILVSVGTFLGGVSLYLLKWNKAFLLRGKPLAVGLFQATALMRLPMDAMEMFGHLTEKGFSSSFMLPIAGCLLTMLADSAISHVHGKMEKEQSSGSNGDLEGKGSSANGVTHHHDASMAVGLPCDSILLIVALCFFSLFGGITIGIAGPKAGARKAMWIISPQGIFAAIAMGIALLRMMPNRPLLLCAVYAFAFAIVISSPIGMAIGIIVDPTAQGAVAGWIFNFFMGLAPGVFWYVFSKLSLSRQYMPIHKFLAKMLRVGVNAVLVIWDAFGCSAIEYL
ncbi:hypothetical protein EUGRSUZ_F02059 [Eucalyptus grandis]|uniref:Uncharacterized protein n=3 Tax=Eucalyptus grandis TaxID=71139 RepID=A0ACC3KGA2_EUCGR|nr:hypothetical protein EUGRSUZ_F02059 [Eucalyptus grandis]